MTKKKGNGQAWSTNPEGAAVGGNSKKKKTKGDRQRESLGTEKIPDIRKGG